MTDYELWETKHTEQMMDAPFPPEMMPDIEKFFYEVHPLLIPGQDVYPEVFQTELFFPLQRQRELARMMAIARKFEPVTVMEIGSDKGGGLYHWCMGLTTVKSVIACEIRGLPYQVEFTKAFMMRQSWPNIGEMTWIEESSYDPSSVATVRECLYGMPLDVLFIDGDKLGMLKDFDAYLPLMRRPGGVVFIHDVRDRGPKETWEILGARRQYKMEHIVDESDAMDAMSRELQGIPPSCPHEAWLRHWKGKSCTVGVIYL